jgi:tRNA A37 threonylcarbamoyladenosine biosynthesis protein TsaE
MSDFWECLNVGPNRASIESPLFHLLRQYRRCIDFPLHHAYRAKADAEFSSSEFQPKLDPSDSGTE